MENKQTAIQWLKEQLYSAEELDLASVVQQALEMEKEQIIQTYKIAQVNVVINDTVRAEQYYFETYKKTKPDGK